MGNKIQGIDTFTQFSNEHKSEEIQALRAKFGMEGYGTYLTLKQMISGAENYKLICDDTGIEMIALSFGMPVGRVTDIIVLLSKFGLFQFQDDILTCEDLVEEIKAKELKKEKDRLKTQRSREKNAIPIEPVKKPAQKAVQQPLLEVDKKEHKLQKFIRDTLLEDKKTFKFARVKRVDRQLTYTEAELLSKNYPDPKYVLHILEDMENRKDLVKKYSHLYKALDNWCKLSWKKWNEEKGIKQAGEKEERRYSKEIGQ